MTLQTISVRQHDGSRVAIAAEIAGEFGIHASLGNYGHLFTVTHLPTMCAVRARMSRAQADELVRRLSLTGIDWSFTDPEKATDLGAVIVPIIRSVLAEVK